MIPVLIVIEILPRRSGLEHDRIRISQHGQRNTTEHDDKNDDADNERLIDGLCIQTGAEA